MCSDNRLPASPPSNLRTRTRTRTDPKYRCVVIIAFQRMTSPPSLLRTRTRTRTRTGKKREEEGEEKTRGMYAGLIHGERKNKLNRTLNKKPKSIT